MYLCFTLFQLFISLQDDRYTTGNTTIYRSNVNENLKVFTVFGYKNIRRIQNICALHDWLVTDVRNETFDERIEERYCRIEKDRKTANRSCKEEQEGLVVF